MPAPIHESYGRLFLRFLRFGLLAWGGPVAQIAMIRQELVEDEGWMEPERFNRVLAVYQALPGPEAHELCVHFGMMARGRIGGVLGGLGFMLPGFVLMLTLSWLYVAVGLRIETFAVVFAAVQPAVLALIARAAHQMGRHILKDGWLVGIAVLAGIAQLLGAHFALTLTAAGLGCFLVRRGNTRLAVMAGIVFFVGIIALRPAGGILASAGASGEIMTVTLPVLFLAGLKTGLLTFGGAYTAIPLLRNDAVHVGRWMTDGQFLDGLALSGILPAPLIIFSTFVGYIGGGLPGALALTFGTFLPAFSFTLVGYDLMERLIKNRALHDFLDGVSAGVIGLIAATALDLAATAISGWTGVFIFIAALVVLYRWRVRWAVAVVIGVAGLVGFIISLIQ